MKNWEDFWSHAMITLLCVVMGLYTYHSNNIAITWVVFGLATVNMIGAVGDYLFGKPTEKHEAQNEPK